MYILLPSDVYANSFTFTPNRIQTPKKEDTQKNLGNTPQKIDVVSSAVLNDATLLSEPSPDAYLEPIPPSISAPQVASIQSRANATLLSAPSSDAGEPSPVIMDKIQNILKALDSTLDPVTKLGFALGIALLICGCIPGIGYIFIAVGILVLFITFLLWLGKCVEDSATGLKEEGNKIQSAKPHNIELLIGKNPNLI